MMIVIHILVSREHSSNHIFWRDIELHVSISLRRANSPLHHDKHSKCVPLFISVIISEYFCLGYMGAFLYP